MAGHLIPILPLRTFTFTNVSLGVQTIVLAERIDISAYIDGVLAVRTHSVNNPGMASMFLNLYGDGYTAEDPGKVFTTSSALFTSPTLGFSPGLQTYGGKVSGQFAKLLLTGSSAGATFTVTISADLVLRTPDDS